MGRERPRGRLSTLWLLLLTTGCPVPARGLGALPHPARCLHTPGFSRKVQPAPGLGPCSPLRGHRGQACPRWTAGSQVACRKPLSLFQRPCRQPGVLAPDLCPSRNRETSAYQTPAVSRCQPTPTSTPRRRQKGLPAPPRRAAASRRPGAAGPSSAHPAPSFLTSVSQASLPHQALPGPSVPPPAL